MGGIQVFTFFVIKLWALAKCWKYFCKKLHLAKILVNIWNFLKQSELLKALDELKLHNLFLMLSLLMYQIFIFLSLQWRVHAVVSVAQTVLLHWPKQLPGIYGELGHTDTHHTAIFRLPQFPRWPYPLQQQAGLCLQLFLCQFEHIWLRCCASKARWGLFHG